MADAPTTTNQTATVVNQIIHDAIFDVAVQAAETAATAEFPFLGAPVVKQIFDAVVNYVAGKIYSALAQTATFTVIDVQVSQEDSAVNKAVASLNATVNSNDQAAIQKANEDFKNAIASLIHYDGSAHP